jgi:phosphohistidine phosphatase
MKTLHLLRHAKSDWDDPDLPDRQRPLNDRGRRDAKRLAGYLEKHPIAVDAVFCSPARRARQTLKAIERVLHAPVTEEEGLYGAGPEEILKFVRRLPGKLDAVLLIGHNPGFEEIARTLLPPAAAAPAFPTCALASLAFDAAVWKSVGAGKATLAGFLTPADLRT